MEGVRLRRHGVIGIYSLFIFHFALFTFHWFCLHFSLVLIGGIVDQEFLSRFVQELAVRAGPVLVLFLASWLLNVAANVWGKVKASRPDLAEHLQYAASLGIAAAEAAGLNHVVQEKKAYAIDVAQDYLARMGLKVDLTLVSNAIESAGLSSGLFKWSPNNPDMKASAILKTENGSLEKEE